MVSNEPQTTQSIFQPPKVSLKDFQEAANERKRLRNEQRQCPTKYKGCYLDLNVATKSLKNSNDAQKLFVELACYMVVLGVCLSIVTSFSSSSGILLNKTVQQQIVHKRVAIQHEQVISHDQQTLANSFHDAPVNRKDWVRHGRDIPNLKPCALDTNSNFQNCTTFSTAFNFESLHSRSEFVHWMGQLPTTSLFARSINTGYLRFANTTAVLGAVRMSQLRYKRNGQTNETCSGNDNCELSTRFFGTPLTEDSSIKTAFHYQTDVPTSKIYSANWGRFDPRYAHGAFMVDLNTTDRKSSERSLEELQQNRWVDNDTALVSTAFTVYHPVSNLVAFTYLHVEFTRSGQALARSHVQIVKRTGSVSSASIITLIFLFCLLLAKLRTTINYFRSHNPTPSSVWRIVDYMILIVGPIAIGIELQVEYRMSSVLSDTYIEALVVNGGRFSTDFESFAWEHQIAKEFAGAGFILAFIKLAKYMEVVPQLSQVGGTLSASTTRLIAWSVIIIPLLITLASSAQLLIGTESSHFNSWDVSIANVLNIWFGLTSTDCDESHVSSEKQCPHFVSYDMLQLFGQNNNNGVFWYIGSLFVFSWILRNILLGILVEAYSTVSKVAKFSMDQANDMKSFLLLSNSEDHRPSWLSYPYSSDHSREGDVLYKRLSTDSSLQTKSIVSWMDLHKAVSEVIQVERADAWCNHLMSIAPVYIDRIEDALLLFHHKDGSDVLGNEHVISDCNKKLLAFHVDQEVLDDYESYNERKLQPRWESDWVRDCESCKILQALILLQHRYIEQYTQSISKDLGRLEHNQLKISKKVSRILQHLQIKFAHEPVVVDSSHHQKLDQESQVPSSAKPDFDKSKLETTSVQLGLEGSQNEFAASVDPKNAVIRNASGKWLVNHTSVNGIHRFVGEFPTRAMALEAYMDMQQNAAKLDEARNTTRSKIRMMKEFSTESPTTNIDDNEYSGKGAKVVAHRKQRKFWRSSSSVEEDGIELSNTSLDVL